MRCDFDSHPSCFLRLRFIRNQKSDLNFIYVVNVQLKKTETSIVRRRATIWNHSNDNLT
ncbi:MAG: hypothetical protein HEEMFOPI_01230 [Holosporales bacterium]